MSETASRFSQRKLQMWAAVIALYFMLAMWLGARMDPVGSLVFFGVMTLWLIGVGVLRAVFGIWVSAVLSACFAWGILGGVVFGVAVPVVLELLGRAVNWADRQIQAKRPVPPEKAELRWYQFSLKTFMIWCLVFGLILGWAGQQVRRICYYSSEREAYDHLSQLMTHVNVTNWRIDEVDFRADSLAKDDWDCLASLPKLKSLTLRDVQITKDDLNCLAGLKALRHLKLSEVPLRDDQLSYLEALPNLQFLELENTETTPKAVKELREKLPRCHVSFESDESGKTDKLGSWVQSVNSLVGLAKVSGKTDKLGSWVQSVNSLVGLAKVIGINRSQIENALNVLYSSPDDPEPNKSNGRPARVGDDEDEWFDEEE